MQYWNLEDKFIIKFLFAIGALGGGSHNRSVWGWGKISI